MGVLYRVGSRLIEAGLAALDVDLRVEGAEHVPASGPGILVSNHIGYLDFALVMLAPPRPRREVRFLARKEFFDKPVLGMLMRRLGQIPVDVHGDPMAAAAATRAALESGALVGLHPEGTISPSFELRRAKSGAVRLAEQTGAPIVPVALWGSQRLLTKGRPLRPERHVTVLVRYGEPFVPEGRTAMVRTRTVMERIGAMLAELQDAYPQTPDLDDPWWLPARLGGSAPTPGEAELRIAEQNARRRGTSGDSSSGDVTAQ
ncbi:MAG: lysophospholipid acyltransferase family protein [Nitriliruptoraceae bacterium]